MEDQHQNGTHRNTVHAKSRHDDPIDHLFDDSEGENGDDVISDSATEYDDEDDLTLTTDEVSFK